MSGGQQARLAIMGLQRLIGGRGNGTLVILALTFLNQQPVSSPAARVSLARAIYADADIYVLDDPLSARTHLVGGVC